MKLDCYIKLFSCVGVVEMVDMTAGQNQPDGWPYDGKSSCASDEVTHCPYVIEGYVRVYCILTRRR